MFREPTADVQGSPLSRPHAPRARYSAHNGATDTSFSLPTADLESTTGSWDVYGVQETKRYPEARRW